MSTVKDIVSKTKHKDGLLKWPYQVLDSDGRTLSEYLRSVTLFLNLFAIDGTAAAMAQRPILRPKAKYPDGQDHLPIDPVTGMAQVGMDADVVKKLLGVRWINYDTALSNVGEQDRIIFQVLVHQSLSKQSMAALKNCVEWSALNASQCDWDDLLNLIITVHTVKRGGGIDESKIFHRMQLDARIKSYKQPAGVATGAHIEKFDDLLMEAKTIGLDITQQDLAFIFINSVHSPAARNKRNALLQLGRPTPNSYQFAKAFVLDAEAVASSVAEFDSRRAKADTGTVFVASGPASASGRSKRERQQYSKLPQKSKDTVNYLEGLVRKVKSGETVDVDVKTIASTVSTLTSATNPGNLCYICGEVGHKLRECKKDPSLEGYPFAPAGFKPRPRANTPSVKTSESAKKNPVAAVQTAAADQIEEDDYDSEGDFGFLGTVMITDGELFFGDDSEDEETKDLGSPMVCVLEVNANTAPGSGLIQRLERDLPSLREATRIPTDEEIVLQKDLTDMPEYADVVLNALGRRKCTVSGGHVVVQGGPFDTNKGKATVFFNIGKSTEKAARDNEMRRQDQDPSLAITRAIAVITKGSSSRDYSRDEDEASEEPKAETGPEAEVAEIAANLGEIEAQCQSLKEAIELAAEGVTEIHEFVGYAKERLDRLAMNLVERSKISKAQEPRSQVSVEQVSCEDRKIIDELRAENSFLAGLLEDAAKDKEKHRLVMEEHETMKLDLENARSLNEMHARAQKSSRVTINSMKTRMMELQEEYEERLEAMMAAMPKHEGSEIEYSEEETDEETRRVRAAGGGPLRVGVKQGPPCGPPVFDPSKRRDITPIFAKKREVDVSPFGENLKRVVAQEDDQDSDARIKENQERLHQELDNALEQVGTSSEDTTVTHHPITEEAERTAKRLKKRADRELANLSSSGIDVDNFAQERSLRYQREREAAQQRETEKILEKVVWDCERSLRVREAKKKTCSEGTAAIVEKEFKRAQFAKEKGGVKGYIALSTSSS